MRLSCVHDGKWRMEKNLEQGWQAGIGAIAIESFVTAWGVTRETQKRD